MTATGPAAGREHADLPTDSDVEAEVVRVAVAITERLDEIRSGMRAVLGDAIAELVGDHRLMDLLTAAIDGNVRTVLVMLREDTPLPRVEVPGAAVEHARRLAEQGVPVFAMVRAYRLGQGYMLDECYAELTRHGSDPRLGLRAYNAINVRVLAYIDWVSQEVVTVYETERDRWVRHQDAARAGQVQEVIAGRGGTVVDVETALRHRLRQHHLAAVVWVEGDGREEPGGLEAVVETVGRALGVESPPLTVAADRATTWAWFPRGATVADPDVDRVSAELRAGDVPGARVALGTTRYGMDGFGASHREALDAREVLLAARGTGRAAIGHHEPGVRSTALLVGDMPRTRAMVRAVLGPLAVDDEAGERLRSTLLAFLSHGSSYTATAAHHALHKNSVRYRVERALELRGRPLDGDRIDVELALVACRWLGGSVLDGPGVGATT